MVIPGVGIVQEHIFITSCHPVVPGFDTGLPVRGRGQAEREFHLSQIALRRNNQDLHPDRFALCSARRGRHGAFAVRHDQGPSLRRADDGFGHIRGLDGVGHGLTQMERHPVLVSSQTEIKVLHNRDDNGSAVLQRKAHGRSILLIHDIPEKGGNPGDRGAVHGADRTAGTIQKHLPLFSIRRYLPASVRIDPDLGRMAVIVRQRSSPGNPLVGLAAGERQNPVSVRIHADEGHQGRRLASIADPHGRPVTEFHLIAMVQGLPGDDQDVFPPEEFPDGDGVVVGSSDGTFLCGDLLGERIQTPFYRGGVYAGDQRRKEQCPEQQFPCSFHICFHILSHVPSRYQESLLSSSSAESCAARLAKSSGTSR